MLADMSISEVDRPAAVSVTQPRLLLQPRGRKPIARDHYERSMRRGIRLTEYEGVLGADLDALTALYPDGVARLWGATPTTSPTSDKARALRERRVGDEVLFYANKAFYARARIGHLFHNQAGATAIWGVEEAEEPDENGVRASATWEHMMALVDVQPLDPAISATELGVSVPVMGMTLKDPAKSARILQQLDTLTRGRTVSQPALDAGTLTRQELITSLTGLRSHQLRGEPSRHKPLALLWAIAQLANHRQRLFSWQEFRDGVRPVLAEFGLPGSSPTAEYPYWHLRTSGLWEVLGVDAGPGFTATPGAFAAPTARAGFTAKVASLLKRTKAQAEAIAVLCEQHLSTVDRAALFARLGLEGFATASGQSGPVDRRTVQTSRQVRDVELAKEIKRMYNDRCQFCGLQVDTLTGYYSEAAHIRGLGAPHDGPDELENMLCLCPNDHVRFDSLAIYIDANWIIRRTKDRADLGKLKRDPCHRIDAAHVQFHRALCGRDT